MKPSTKIAFAGLLSASGAFLTALAADFGSTPATETPEPATPADPPAAKRGRKAAAEKAAVEEKPADPEPETPAKPEQKEEPSVGKTYEELKAIIEPHVKEGRGAEVKKIIAKHDPTGNPPSIKTMPAKNHAAFEKDIAQLGY